MQPYNNNHSRTAVTEGFHVIQTGCGRFGRGHFYCLVERSFPRGDWPDGPNKAWFENLQRPDNHLHPYRKLDPKSLYCCGEADAVKTKFKVESNGGPHPEDTLVRLAQ